MRRISGAIESRIRDRGEDAIGESISQSRAMIGVRVAPPVRSLQGETEPDDAWHVLGSPAPTLLLATASLLEVERRPPAHIQQTHALWSVELVRRQREQIDAESIDMQRQHARSLHSVGMQRNASVSGNRGNLLDGLNS